jgi:hypothetical protein
MYSINKGFSLLFVVILVVSSLIIVESALAQSIPKPPVPEFTLLATDHTYYVPPSGHIDLNTGQFIKYAGQFVKNGSIELSIKNQPFTSYYDSNGYPIKLYYHIRVKGHFTNDWYYLPNNNAKAYFTADNSPYTTRIFSYNGNEIFYGSGASFAYPSSGKLDFQVEAFIGHLNVTDEEFIQHLNATHINPSARADDFIIEYVGQSSNWSNTKTITIPDGPGSISTSPNPTLSPTPTIPELPILVILPLFVAIPLITTVLLRKNHLSKGL